MSERANAAAIAAIDSGSHAGEHDTQGFRSSYLTLLRRYLHRSAQWPSNSGVTGRLSQQEVRWIIGELRMAGVKNEMARLVAGRLSIWQWGKSQAEAAEYLSVNDREIRFLDRLVSSAYCPMYPVPYCIAPLDRKRAWRPGIASRILGRMLSTELTTTSSNT